MSIRGGTYDKARIKVINVWLFISGPDRQLPG